MFKWCSKTGERELSTEIYAHDSIYLCALVQHVTCLAGFCHLGNGNSWE